MSTLALLGMTLSLTASLPATPHSIVVQHSSGPAQVDYRSQLAIEHRQIGSVAPGGRASTLRCMWTANLLVDRTATSRSGSIASRSFVHSDLASGHRPGWCTANKRSIERDVAARMTDSDVHIAKAAEADQQMLHAELDRLGSRRNAG